MVYVQEEYVCCGQDVFPFFFSYVFFGLLFGVELFPVYECAAHCDHPFVFLVADQYEYAVFRLLSFFDFEVYAFDFALFFSAFSK